MFQLRLGNLNILDDALVGFGVITLAISEVLTKSEIMITNYESFIDFITILARVLAIISFSWTIGNRLNDLIKSKNGKPDKHRDSSSGSVD
jgi:hypothetical protein